MPQFTVTVKALHPSKGWQKPTFSMEAEDATEAKMKVYANYGAPYSHFQVIKVEEVKAEEETKVVASTVTSTPVKKTGFFPSKK